MWITFIRPYQQRFRFQSAGFFCIIIRTLPKVEVFYRKLWKVDSSNVLFKFLKENWVNFSYQILIAAPTCPILFFEWMGLNDYLKFVTKYFHHNRNGRLHEKWLQWRDEAPTREIYIWVACWPKKTVDLLLREMKAIKIRYDLSVFRRTVDAENGIDRLPSTLIDFSTAAITVKLISNLKWLKFLINAKAAKKCPCCLTCGSFRVFS